MYRIQSNLNKFDRENYGFDVIDNSSILDRKDAVEPMVFEIAHNDKGIKIFKGASYNNSGKDICPIFKYQFDKSTKYTSSSSWHLSVPLGENIFDVISSNESIRKEIGDLFKNYDLKFSFDKSTREFKILKDVGDDIFLISYSMIADTLHRLIFFKTAIKSNKDSILLFEEPEAHMFPPYIRKFTADVMFDKTNQFFIATHSPYVLEEFMEEVKEDLAVYVVDYHKGETIIKRLSDDEMNEIAQYGIDLFFNLESYLDKHGESYST